MVWDTIGGVAHRPIARTALHVTQSPATDMHVDSRDRCMQAMPTHRSPIPNPACIGATDNGRGAWIWNLCDYVCTCILIEYDPMIITVWYRLVVGGVFLLLLGLHT